MPLNRPLDVTVAAPVTRPYPEPRILWPTARWHGDDGGSDSRAFPSLEAVKTRKNECPPDGLAAFVEAVWMAQDRILILDDHLFDPVGKVSRQSRYDQILFWFQDDLVANEIQVLTNAHEAEQGTIQKQFNERAAEINRSAPRRAGTARIEIRFSLKKHFDYVHDRFAIIDNELWHFGATVGGLHNLVNAATRGWNAEALDAVRFFREAWASAANAKGKRRHG